MNRERKRPFDPKAFLSKVNGGRAISDYRKDQNVYTQERIRGFTVFYIQSGKVKKLTVVSEQGKEAVVALLGTGDFFGGRVLDRTAAASVDRHRRDGMRDRANSKGRHHPRDPPRASICRAIHRAPLGSQFVSRRTWLINCSIRARSRWHACFCFWRILARKVGQSQSLQKSAKRHWRR